MSSPRRPGCQAGVAVCRRPPVTVLTAGCVHEHMRVGAICEYHLGRALICRECHDHPVQPHPSCPVHQLARDGVRNPQLREPAVAS